MDTIIIKDLEIWARVGVTEAERSKPQKLLVTVEIQHDFDAAAAADDLRLTVDYYAASRRLLQMGTERTWNLIETAAVEMARSMLSEFGATKVTVEVKKFVVPEARWVAVRVTRERG